MNDKRTKEAITELLKDKGFEVTPLEESHEPTPDLLAEDLEFRFLIEIKERHGELRLF